MRKLIGIVALSCIAVAAQAQTYFFGSNMDGTQEVPSASTMAFGRAALRVVVDSNGATYYEGMIRVRALSAAPTAFHIHVGNAGANGSVLVNLSGNFNIVQDAGGGNYNLYVRGQIVDITAGGNFYTRADIVQRMRNSGMYFNVHTSTFPGGEIRGQVVENN